MSLPEGYLPREGDVLVLHVAVKYDVDPGEKNVFVIIPPNKHNMEFVPLESFVGVKRRQWKEGAKVRHRDISGMFGEVVAMSGDYVWIQLGTTGGFITAHCNEIEIDPIATGLQPLRDHEHVETSEHPRIRDAIAEGRTPTLDEVAEVVKPKEEPDVAF